MLEKAPIGVFDSGLGGLTVAKNIIEKLPDEDLIYVGDEAHVPYGDKSPDAIRNYALGIIDFFVNKGAKLVVMACNMSSAHALQAARMIYPDLPIIGTIEAGARNAAEVSAGKIGIIATNGTVASHAYTKSIRAINPLIDVIEQGCPKLVPIVEDDQCESREADEAVGEYIQPILEAGADTIILGCTHYPFLLNAIKKVTGDDVMIIDPAERTVDEVKKVLVERGLSNSPDNEPIYTYCTTADPERFEHMGGRFLSRKITVNCIRWGIDLRENNRWSEKMKEQTMNSVP